MYCYQETKYVLIQKREILDKDSVGLNKSPFLPDTKNWLEHTCAPGFTKVTQLWINKTLDGARSR